jgi:hypothetical protein
VKFIKRIIYLCITKPADTGDDPSQVFDDGRVTSLKKILVLFPLAIIIMGLALWGSVSLVIDLFTDDPFDPNDDDDWLWVVFIFVGIIVLSFFSDAWGAATQKTNMDLRADAANRIYIKNNSADSNQEKSKEQRLVELETLFQKGLIDKSEYVSSRLKILGE